MDLYFIHLLNCQAFLAGPICGSIEQHVCVRVMNVKVIPCVNDGKIGPFADPHEIRQPSGRFPSVYNLARKVVLDTRVRPQGRENRNDAADGIRRDQLRQIREAGGQDQPSEMRPADGAEVLGHGGRHCGSQTLAQENDALGRDFGNLQRPVYDGDAIRDQALLRRVPGGAAEASIIERKDVDLGGIPARQGAVGIRSPTLADSAGVAVN